MALIVRVERNSPPVSKNAPPSNPPHPPHHVIPVPSIISRASSGWASYLPSWDPSPAETRPAATKQAIAGFRNPWPSWHKPTHAEIWDSLQWGEDDDPCIELAASHLSGVPAPPYPPDKTKLPHFSDVDDWPNSTGAKAARLLSIQDPDFSFTTTTTTLTPTQPTPKAKATWLGHAGILVQLPPLTPSSRPIRCLFDPIFSMRCSPSQTAGPIRSYPSPCEVHALPPIDAVIISHNHYDHLDYDTIKSIWQHHSPTVHFFVPLNNRSWFATCGIPLDRVTELDWWESAHLTSPDTTITSGSSSLKIWCTPAQHSSGRAGNDANCTLWSSWYLEHLPAGGAGKPYRVYFAGDTGYQFHGLPSWPPAPNSKSTNNPDDDDDQTSPPCPAFAEIRTRLGPPHLLLLPVAVGATYAYLRSLVPLPDWISPFPRHRPGLAAATHMPPWDAVRVLNVMAGSRGGVKGGDEDEEDEREEGPVAIAMHWGTFVTEPVGVLKTLGELEWACTSQGVRFARSLEGTEADGLSRKQPCFLAVNHGQSVWL
ncbi:beta-lactamase superfamily domain-containing protein [Podospora appendiculata]|uniref:Beta-lactamase superfamily domain-containing protein n=1 Tax=Podospora appendiculata TaxID=314037 RepID=A0AAE1CG25_9PEZI|nr:beta-lactamase superfamily domain-containing protein [Podospora appendiculata]